LTLDSWNRQIERWIDIFSDDEPDLMGLQLVRGFDNLTKRFNSIFNDDLNESRGNSESYMSIRSEICSEEEVVVVKRISYSDIKQKERKVKRKVEQVSMPVKRGFDNATQSSIKGEQHTSEDIIVTDKNVKIVSQLPINNRKENIKVNAYDDDNSITISYLNNGGKRCTLTSDILYDVDFESAKATYKNGILEVMFDRR
jgi:HSP20 family molecular chaperone IbpA